MSLANKITVFTTAVKAEFMTAYEPTAVQAPYTKFTTVIPSTGRYENYPFLTPTAGIRQYFGHRKLAKIGEYVYSLVNLEFEDSLEILLRDIRDDQTGGYMLKSRELAIRAQEWPGRQVLNNVAKGKSTKCFDGSNFFSATHTFGAANNLMTYTGTGNSDGLTYNMIVLITTSPIKPLMWQQRMEMDLQNNLDSPESKFRKKAYFWVDLEGAPGFGRFHDAILMQFTNKPNVTDMQLAMGNIEDRFRTFSLPTALPDDAVEYVHEQLVFSPETATILSDSRLGNILRQVLHQDTIVQSGAAVTNVYKGWADLVTSAIINTVS